MGSRRGGLMQRVRTRLRRRDDIGEVIERLDRLLYLAENERRAVDEALSAILERLRLLEDRIGAGDAAREARTPNR